MTSRTISRQEAQELNPLIGTHAKDTYALVAQAMRAMSEAELSHPLITAHMADLGAAALEYEDGLLS